jgi:hypothetical protein
VDLQIFAHNRNYGYGAHQKTCYAEVLKAGADVIVMVHPDYQYDPKLVPQIIEKSSSQSSTEAGIGDSARCVVLEVHLQPLPHRPRKLGVRPEPL